MKKKYYFYAFAVILLITKLFLMRNVKLYAITNAAADDELMVTLAENILQGRWLGIYDQFTLVKGAFFPVFLAAGKILNIDYISWVQIWYALACIFAVRAVKPLIQKEAVLYILFVILFFHPIMSTWTVVQRVYRNSVTQAQVLFVFGGYIGAFVRGKDGIRTQIKWLLAAGLGLASIWLCREDGMWIVPFAVIAGCVIAASGWKKSRVRYGVLSIVPLVILWGSIQIVSVMNYVVYGCYTDNELNKGAFSDTMRNLYSIDLDTEELEYADISRAKLEKVYEISPAMAEIEEELEELMDSWSQNTGHKRENKEAKEVENGWFFWVLRDAAAAKGYYASSDTANEFFYRVSDEIEQAMAEGKIKSRTAMPSALMPPWKKGVFPDLLAAMWDSSCFVTEGENLGLRNIRAVDDGKDGIERFREMTGREVEYEPERSSTRYTPENAAVNRINDVWQFLFPVLVWSGRISYILLSVLWLFRKVRENEASLLLMATGVLGAVLCLYAGISYNELYSCPSIHELYLSAAYPSVTLFYMLCVCGAGQTLIYVIKFGNRTKMGNKYD